MNEKIIGILLVAVVSVTAIAIVTAQQQPSTPFVISGSVFNAAGSPCNNPCVEISNTNKSESWDARNSSILNYYLLVRDSDEIEAGNILQFSASGCGQSTTVEHTVNKSEMDCGGFMFNISLEALQANEFDTREGTYPSIFGTHYGKIIPDENITANKIYTYPCAGTGGHIESVKIRNKTTNESAVAEWSGYAGDYHNLTFNTTLNLRSGVVYNYTIKTGSYPQIIHAPYKQVAGGNITCTSFEDANGRTYHNWIPAIKLFYEE